MGFGGVTTDVGDGEGDGAVLAAAVGADDGAVEAAGTVGEAGLPPPHAAVSSDTDNRREGRIGFI